MASKAELAASSAARQIRIYKTLARMKGWWTVHDATRRCTEAIKQDLEILYRDRDVLHHQRVGDEVRKLALAGVLVRRRSKEIAHGNAYVYRWADEDE